MDQHMRTLALGATVLLLAAGSSATAQPQRTAAHARAFTAPPGEVRQVQALGVRPTGLREYVGWAYNTYDCPNCYGGVNIAWNDFNCYLPGGDCNGEIYILPLNTAPLQFGGETLQAPIFNDGQGNSWITDVFFDDYASEYWYDWYELKPLLAFSTLAWTYNDYGSGVDKTFVFHCLWFSESGEEFYGGWAWHLPALDGENLIFEAVAGTLDEPLDPAMTFGIPHTGLLCLDYENNTLEGHDDGGAFAFFLGGDLTDPSFPDPRDLYEVGFNEQNFWWAGGFGDPNIDPGWDDEPGVSRLDTLNTGHLVDWYFASDAGQLAHGYPARMAIPDAVPICGDIDGNGEVTTSDLGNILADFGCTGGGCAGDVDGDGDTDQQDLAWWATYWGCDSSYNPDVPCGPCEQVGTGTLDVNLIAVDNSDVGPGDDPEEPLFNGGVTHFTFDLVATITADNDWTTQWSHVELMQPGLEFFDHYRGDYKEPLQVLVDILPALAYDTFYADPPVLFDNGPGFALLDLTDTSLEAVWFDRPREGDYVATTQRLTLVIPQNSDIDPAVLPDDCAQEYAVLAQINTDATARSTGSDLHHYEFIIVDLAQPLCPGDINGDSFVGQADLGILLSTYNRPPDDPQYNHNADLDCDGDVDQSDLGALLGNYGADC